MIETTLTLVNPKGLHARASHKLSETVGQFDCKVRIFFKDHQADASQIMSIMLLAAPVGSELLFQFKGKEAKQCMEAVTELVNQGLGELGERA